MGPAPSTSTRSPAATCPRSIARTPIDSGSASAAIAALSTLVANACASGIRSSSWRPPSSWIPIRLKLSQALPRPIRHG